MSTTLSRQKLISIAAAAEATDVSTRTIRRRIADGTLPAYRVGSLIKIDPADLDRLMRRIPTAGGDAA